MKRYHEEKHIIDNRVRKYKKIAGWLDPSDTRFLPDAGRFRKSIRCAGCGRARCQVCHPEKFPKRQPTRQEIQFKKNADSWE
jgi:hypothetical protein